MIHFHQQQLGKISNYFQNKINRRSNTQTVLRNRLHEFGLSPSDWKIIAEPNQYRIVHVETPDFQFIGHANPGKTRWESLKLFSL